MTTTTPTPRERFLELLNQHEEAMAKMFDTVDIEGISRAAILERYRLSRRSLVAAYDQASLGVGVQE